MKRKGKRKHQRKPRQQRKIAKRRIRQLLDQAGQVFAQDKQLANRYVQLARKVAMKSRVRIPAELKKRFCKHCYSYLVPGKNCRVRISDGKIVYCCLECRHFMRFPHRK